MDQDSIDRIRSATFPIGRRGYEKREVDRFLTRVAEWLETGAGDQARSDVVRRELERVGQKTVQILTAAEDAAQQLRADAEHGVRELVEQAEAKAGEARAEADRYVSEKREAVDAQAKRVAEEGQRRRREIEIVISDLEERRDAVIGELERLASEVAGTATQHKPGAASRGGTLALVGNPKPPVSGAP